MPVNREFILSGWSQRYAFSGHFFLFIFLLGCLVFIPRHRHASGNQVTKSNKNGRSDAISFPRQSNLSKAEPLTFVRPDYTWRLHPRAGYQIAARVLQSTSYDDWQAGFSPLDLALGWGVMSDPAVDRWVEVRQQDRWYFYQKQKDSPLSLADISESSANVHIIPANESVAAVIQALQPNDIVTMEGKLVDVEVDRAGEFFHFQTSLTRLDTDENSCEIFYVEQVVVEARKLPQGDEGRLGGKKAVISE
jgi:hypothetical protein